MPLILSGIVVDPVRSAKRESAVGAAHEHHICSIAVAGRPHAGQHVDVVIRRTAGAVNPQEYLAC
jgi:hypothetical protein